MARKIEAMVPDGRASGKYPWAEWLDGDAWELVRGEDFTVTTSSLKTVIHQAASRAGLVATVRVKKDKVYIQATQPE
jgi:hypothetical protein